MTDQESIARFIMLRSQGLSFNRIAVDLQISKPTLIKWSRQYKLEINNFRATETEALAERIFGERDKRWESLGRQLQKIEAEIDRRDLEEIPASRLHGIANQLRAEIRAETAPQNQHLPLAERTTAIPEAESNIWTSKWEG